MRDIHALAAQISKSAVSLASQPAVRARFRRLRIRNPRHETRLALNFFNVHAAILPEPAKTQKPTVGF